MSTYIFSSCLAPQIQTFVNLRQLSGTDYHSQVQLLGYFDQFLVKQGLQQPLITREIIDSYQQSLVALAPRSQSNRFCVVRQLCKYLARGAPFNYVPESLQASSSYQAYKPYIFAHEEVTELLAAAAQLSPAEALRPHTYRTLFGLLYSTGIRIGEALALNIENFFFDEKRLYISEGKFHKSRWIVLSSSTAQAIGKYIDCRMSSKPNALDAPLLLNERKRRLCHPTVYITFRSLLKECGISYNKHKGPRIHDLRHTFAVHRLLDWYQHGEDINAKLPALATYMGHVDISSTRVYLQPTAELLGEVNRRFHNHYLKHFASKGTLS